MTAPLAWLLLAAVAVVPPPAHQVVDWAGRAPLVVVQPATVTPGSAVRVAVAALPRGSHAVLAIADRRRWPGRRLPSGVYVIDVIAPGTAGPFPIELRFTYRGTRYRFPGALVDVQRK